MNRICKLIHTDLKPENVVIALTKKELREIKEKGVLKTTKMYHQKDEQIARAVAGAHEDIILSQREIIENRQDKQRKETEHTNSELGMSKDWSELTGKEKKKLYKKKRKQIKKLITQGRLPQNYDDLPKEEKDKLYQEVRQKINQSNLIKEGLTPAKDKSQDHEKEDAKNDIEIDINDIGLAESTQATFRVEETRQVENKTEQKDINKNSDEFKNKEQQQPTAKPRKSPQKFRHSSAPKI